MRKNVSLHARKGWASLYALVLLNFVLALLLLQTTKFRSYQRVIFYQSELEEAEIVAVRKIKKDYINYEESDCVFSYKEMSIEIDYEGMEANVMIITSKETIKFRVVYDDLDENITEFEYVE